MSIQGLNVSITASQWSPIAQTVSPTVSCLTPTVLKPQKENNNNFFAPPSLPLVTDLQKVQDVVMT